MKSKEAAISGALIDINFCSLVLYSKMGGLRGFLPSWGPRGLFVRAPWRLRPYGDPPIFAV
jgi:hypothetical protein